MILLVDGYNLYYTAIEGPSKELDLEKAREEVIGRLRRFCLERGWKAIIFFDGGVEGAHLPRMQLREGIEVRFSPPRSDADTDIKTFIGQYPNPSQLRLITSDRAIQRFAENFHVPWTPSREFLDEVEAELRKDEDAARRDEPLEKYEGPGDGDVEYWLRIFGKPKPR